jgi:hypothetical protein
MDWDIGTILAKIYIFLSFTACSPLLGPTQHPLKWLLEAYQPEREADRTSVCYRGDEGVEQ